MNLFFQKFTAIFVITVIFPSFFLITQTEAATPDELRTQIEQRAQELSSINQKIQETNNSLIESQVRGKTLKSEINRFDYNINQLGLSIQASQITVEKLGLEIESFQGDIADKEDAINMKRQAIGRLLQSFREKDGEGLLISFLNNKTLAESLSETQSLTSINDSLLTAIAAIQQIKSQLSDQLNQVSQKKIDKQKESEKLKIQKGIVEDQRSDRQNLLVQTKNQEKNYQQTISDLEKKQQAISDEIGAIEAQLRASFDPSLLPIKRSGVLADPVSNPVITQEYGATSFAARAYKTAFHNGIDFSARIGTPIFAADDGQVIAAGNNGRIQYGRFVLIKHGNNLATLYAHLSRQLVTEGAIVKRGDLIGYSGNTGYAFGAHLHFGVYWAPSVSMKYFPGAGLVPIGTTIDPRFYL